MDEIQKEAQTLAQYRATWLLAELVVVCHPDFYGELTMKFERGRIVLLRKTETLKPPVSDDS